MAHCYDDYSNKQLKLINISPNIKFMHINKLSKEKKDRKHTLKEIAKKYTDKKVTLYNADAILIAVYGFVEQNKER